MLEVQYKGCFFQGKREGGSVCLETAGIGQIGSLAITDEGSNIVFYVVDSHGHAQAQVGAVGGGPGIGDQHIVRVRIHDNIALGIDDGIVTNCGD